MKYFNMVGKYTKLAFMSATETQAAIAVSVVAGLLLILGLL